MASVHLDCSRRVQKALTRNAAPVHEKYRPGDLVVYRRDEQIGGTKWSGAARVTGQESPESIWVIHIGLPVLCSVHALRPANKEEVLVNGIPVLPSEIIEGRKTRRGYLDCREQDPEEEQPQEPEEKRARSEKRAPKRKQEAPRPNIYLRRMFSFLRMATAVRAVASLRSVVGSLAWVARYARPDLCYRVNCLRRACSKATGGDLT